MIEINAGTPGEAAFLLARVKDGTLSDLLKGYTYVIRMKDEAGWVHSVGGSGVTTTVHYAGAAADALAGSGGNEGETGMVCGDHYEPVDPGPLQVAVAAGTERLAPLRDALQRAAEEDMDPLTVEEVPRARPDEEDGPWHGPVQDVSRARYDWPIVLGEPWHVTMARRLLDGGTPDA